MKKILINNELFFVENDGELLSLIDQHMGHDTHDAVQEMLDKDACNGECDETYKVEGHYQQIIRDAADELRGVEVYQRHKAHYNRILRVLEAAL